MTEPLYHGDMMNVGDVENAWCGMLDLAAESFATAKKAMGIIPDINAAEEATSKAIDIIDNLAEFILRVQHKHNIDPTSGLVKRINTLHAEVGELVNEITLCRAAIRAGEGRLVPASGANAAN